MTSHEILKINLLNTIGEQTGQKLNILDELFETFRGRCMINIDRSWNYGQYFIDHMLTSTSFKTMKDQILIKTPVHRQYLQHITTDILYMPIIKDAMDWSVIDEHNLRIYAVELIFKYDNDRVVCREFMDLLEKRGIRNGQTR